MRRKLFFTAPFARATELKRIRIEIKGDPDGVVGELGSSPEPREKICTFDILVQDDEIDRLELFLMREEKDARKIDHSALVLASTTKTLNQLRDDALHTARAHGFTDATIGEDVALMHSELSELLEDHRAGKLPEHMWYEGSDGRAFLSQADAEAGGCWRPKPCGIPSELADLLIRAFHFAGKHEIDLDRAVHEKMSYNATRPFKHGKVL